MNVITSPPFSQPETRDRTPVQAGSVSNQFSRKTPGAGGAYTVDRQTMTEGNIARLSIIGSPPFMDSLADRPSKTLVSSGLRMGQSSMGTDGYGSTPGQIGSMKGGSMTTQAIDIPTEQWYGCYDEGWGDLIVPDAYAHPAKMARGLAYRIVREGLQRGWWAKGSVCVDPFGGIGTTGLVCAAHGLQAHLCELEQKFVDLARQNFDLHRKQWEALGLPLPTITQGDSRRLGEVLTAAGHVMTSPPYGATRFDGGPSETGQFGDGYRPPGNYSQDKANSGNSVVDTKALHGVTYYVCEHCLLAKIAEPQSDDAPDGASHAAPNTSRNHSRGVQSPSGGGPRSQPDTSTSPTHSTTQRTIISGMAGGNHGGATLGASNDGLPLNATAILAKAQGLTKACLASITSEIRTLLEASGTTHSPTLSPFAGPATSGSMAGVCILCGASSAEQSTSLVPVVLGPAHRSVEPSSTPPSTTAGKLSSAQPDDYWSACRDVYRQCWDIMTPGGHMALVVKGYVKAKKYVDLPAQTLDLLLSLGFEPVLWVEAMLVAAESQPGLLDDTQEYRKERKSFFRRLAEAKGSPRIDAEIVLVVRKA